MRQVVPADTQRARGLRSLERNVLEGALALFITDPLRERERERPREGSRNVFLVLSSPLSPPPPTPPRIPLMPRAGGLEKRNDRKLRSQLTHRPLQRPYLCLD